MPGEGRPPLTPVPENPDAEDVVQIDWSQPTPSINWGQQAVLVRRAATHWRQKSRDGKDQNQNPESAYSSAVPSRVGTGLGGGTVADTSNPQSNAPSRTLTMRDQHGNTAEATEDSPGSWNVRVFFSRKFAQAIENRSQTTTGIKIGSGGMLIPGEAMKAAEGGVKAAAKPVKMTGDVGMALTAAMDAVVYGHSAWQTYKTEGLSAALKDGRKALLQTFALAATVTAATLGGGENPIAKAVAAGAQLMGAASATGDTHQAELEAERLREMAGLYRLEEGQRLESASNLGVQMNAELRRQETDLTLLTGTPSASVNFNPLGGGTPQSSAPASVREMMPDGRPPVSRTTSQNSGFSLNSGGSATPQAVPESKAEGKKPMKR
jgi:hypothetical protein